MKRLAAAPAPAPALLLLLLLLLLPCFASALDPPARSPSGGSSGQNGADQEGQGSEPEPEPGQEAEGYVRPPRHYALCFYGLTRSLVWTLPTIEHHIFRLIREAGDKFDIFLHTYHVETLTNPRAGETGEYTHGDDYKLLNVTRALVTSQNELDKRMDMDFEMQDIRARYEYGNAATVLNLFRARYSLSMSWELMAAQAFDNGKEYDAVVVLRPDVAYLMDIDITKRVLLPPNKIFVPNWGRYHGVNDRFAYGAPDAMRVYMNRFEPCDPSKLNLPEKYNSEVFLMHQLQFGGREPIETEDTPMLLVRMRMDGHTQRNDWSYIKKACSKKLSPFACDLESTIKQKET